MSLTGTLFLFVFLPLSLGIYHLAKDSVKDYILLGFSLIFYALGSLDYFLLFVVLTALVVYFGRIIDKSRKKSVKRVFLILGIVLNVLILGYYKYSDFAILTINNIFGLSKETKELLLPLGISFFTFKSISYLADIYTGKTKPCSNPCHDALYLSFFGQIQSGPLTRHHDFTLVTEKEERRALFCDGVFRFMIGFNKKCCSQMFCPILRLRCFQLRLRTFRRRSPGLGQFVIPCSCSLILPDIRTWH